MPKLRHGFRIGPIKMNERFEFSNIYIYICNRNFFTLYPYYFLFILINECRASI